jgi:hypothetical protein
LFSFIFFNNFDKFLYGAVYFLKVGVTWIDDGAVYNALALFCLIADSTWSDLMSKYTREERTLLMQMAELRADQVAWAAIAEKLGKPLLELKVLKATYPHLWQKLLAQAQRELLADANQEVLQALVHMITQQPDHKTVLKAANTFARLAHTQAKLTETPKPKAKPKAKNEAQPAAKEPVVKNFPAQPLPNAKLPNGTMAPNPLETMRPHH